MTSQSIADAFDTEELAKQHWTLIFDRYESQIDKILANMQDSKGSITDMVIKSINATYKREIANLPDLQAFREQKKALSKEFIKVLIGGVKQDHGFRTHKHTLTNEWVAFMENYNKVQQSVIMKPEEKHMQEQRTIVFEKEDAYYMAKTKLKKDIVEKCAKTLRGTTKKTSPAYLLG